MVGSMMMYLVLDEALYSLFKGGVPEDEEEWQSYFAGLAMSPLNLFPGGRELTGYYRFGDVSGPYSTTIKTIGKASEAAYNTAIGEAELEDTWDDFAKGVTAVLGLPLTQVIRLLDVGFSNDLNDDERREKILKMIGGGISVNLAEALN